MFSFLNPYILWIKLALVAGLVAGASTATWYVVSDHYEVIIETAKAANASAYAIAVQAQRDVTSKHLNDLTTAEIQHDKDQKLIGFLHDESGSVSVHIPVRSCAAGKGNAAGKSADGIAGVFSADVDGAFKHLQEGVERRIVNRCGQLNIDVIRQNSSLGAK